MPTKIEVFESAGRMLAKYAAKDDKGRYYAAAGGAALAGGGGYLANKAVKARRARREAAEAAAREAAARSARRSARLARARRFGRKAGVAGGVLLGAVAARKGAQSIRSASVRRRNREAISGAKKALLKQKIKRIPDTSFTEFVEGGTPFKPRAAGVKGSKKTHYRNMNPIDVVALEARQSPQSIIKKSAEISAANRMSKALSAVRTKSGGIGGPGSVGRVAGAPSVHAPSAMGVQKAPVTNAPSLGFPQIARPPRT